MEPMSTAEAKGLLRSLFDFGFTSLITTKIIRFVYALLVVLYTLGAFGLFIAGLASGSATGVFAALILVPLGYIVYLILIRMWMEFLIVVFRIGDDIHAIRVGGQMGGGTPYPLP
jgi:Zn-dependent protease with chaperone function